MTYRYIFILALFISTNCLLGCQPENPDKRTDAVIKLYFRYLNEHKLDSLYQLTDSNFRKFMPRRMFMGYSEKFVKLSPFTKVDYITGNDSVSFYKIKGKIPLNCYMSLDKQGKIKTVDIGREQADIKPVSMNLDERKVDALAHKVLILLAHKQVDSMYLLAGDTLKSKTSASQWRNNSQGMLEYIPFPPAGFLRGEKDVNVYAMGPFRFKFGSLDKAGKFNTFYFQLFTQQAQKSLKVMTDNKLKTKLDSAVDKVLSPYIQTMNNIGVSAAILYKGKTYFYNYGERKKGENNLPDKHTVYDIGSITKTFTGTLLAVAVTEKKITLETPITKYLPDSVTDNPDLKNITFKQLANHTSGLPREGDNRKETVTDVDQPYENYDTQAMFSYLKHFKQTRQPGTKYDYSNIGFGLLGVLLERVYQKPYVELLSQYITKPLKMNETVLSVDSLKAKDLAQGYDGLSEPVPFFKLSAVSAAGEIKSSTYDLIAYAKAQLSAPDPTLNASIQLSHQVTFDGVAIPGLGWEYLWDNRAVLAHGGLTGGYCGAVAVDLHKQVAVVVLTNNTNRADLVGWNLIKAVQAIK